MEALTPVLFAVLTVAEWHIGDYLAAVIMSWMCGASTILMLWAYVLDKLTYKFNRSFMGNK